VLNNRLRNSEIEEKLNRIRDLSSIESSAFNAESFRDVSDHDYTAR
jgi:hypothetical protein